MASSPRARASFRREEPSRACQVPRSHGTILGIALVAVAVAWGGRAFGLAGDADQRARRIGELEVYLSLKEKELKRLKMDYTGKALTAEIQAKNMEEEEGRRNRSWFQQRALERDKAKLRSKLEEISRIDKNKRAVQEEAFAAAAALVGELESALESELMILRGEGSAETRESLIEKVQTLDNKRRSYQHRMNELMPSVPLPALLPAGVRRSREMAEDECMAYAAATARLGAEREDLLRERRLRTSLMETLADREKTREAAELSRIEGLLADNDRRLSGYRQRISERCPDAGGSE